MPCSDFLSFLPNVFSSKIPHLFHSSCLFLPSGPGQYFRISPCFVTLIIWRWACRYLAGCPLDWVGLMFFWRLDESYDVVAGEPRRWGAAPNPTYQRSKLSPHCITMGVNLDTPPSTESCVPGHTTLRLHFPPFIMVSFESKSLNVAHYICF